MSTMNSDLAALERMARFPEGVSADPTKNMSPEDAAKWKAMNEEHGDKFKQAFDELAALDMDLTAGSIPEVALDRDAATLEEMGRLAAIDRAANQMVAKTILDQMGGQRRLMAMIGATNFISHNNPPGVSFKFMQTARPSKTGNYIKILLDEGLDLYDVEFGYAQGYNYRKVKELSGVDAEALGRIFRQQTGLALRLAAEQVARFERLACDCEDDGDEMMARFEEGVSADPTEHMSPEDAAKWKAENDKNRDKFKTAAAANYLIGLAPDGAAMVDGIVDEVLFGLIYARVMGYRYNQVAPVNQKIVSVKGHRKTFREALEELLQFNTGSQQYDIKPRGRNTYFIRSVNIAKTQLDAMTDDEEAAANARDFGFKGATFEEGSRIPDGWDPGETRPSDGSVVESEEGSDIPDGQGNKDKRAGFDTIQLVALVKGTALYGATEPLGNPYTKAYWAGPEHKLAPDILEGASVVTLYDVPLAVAEQLVDVGTRSTRINPMMAFRMAKPYLKGGQGHKLTASKEAASGLYGYTRKIQADCESSTRKLQREASRIAKAAYGKSEKVAEFLSTHAKRADSLSAKILVAALSELGPKVAAEMQRTARLEELRAQRQAVSGVPVVGDEKWIPKDLEEGRCTPGSPNYDCPEGSPQWNLAQTFKKHPEWGEKGGKHAEEDELLAMFKTDEPADPTENMSPEDAAKWKAENAKHRDQFKGAAGPQDKPQSDLMAIVGKWPASHSEALSDIARNPAFRGVHFAKIMSAAEALAKKGLLKFDGVTVKKAATKAAGSGPANAKYLDGLPPRTKDKILKAVAKHYGVSVPEIEVELKDRDAEALYEYLAFDHSMAMQVYRDFKGMRLASDDKTARSYGMYGYNDRVASLGLTACTELKSAAGRIASDLHRRRAAKHAQITGFFDAHNKTAGCNYSRMLHGAYPEATMRLASQAPRTVQAWLEWDDED